MGICGGASFTQGAGVRAAWLAGRPQTAARDRHRLHRRARHGKDRLHPRACPRSRLPWRVTSPTFTIVNEYEGDIPLFHFDLYRLGSSDELFDIGWEDYLARGGVCAVEWSERAEDAFDGSTVRIDFRRGAQHDGWRVITITGVDGV